MLLGTFVWVVHHRLALQVMEQEIFVLRALIVELEQSIQAHVALGPINLKLVSKLLIPVLHVHLATSAVEQHK